MQKKDVHLGEHTENHISLTEKDTGQLVKEIKALHKQQIKAPTTYLDMMQQIAYFGGLCQMFFGQYSDAMQAIRSLTS